MTYIEDHCSYTLADSVRRFNVRRVLILKKYSCLVPRQDDRRLLPQRVLGLLLEHVEAEVLGQPVHDVGAQVDIESKVWTRFIIFSF